MIGNTRLYPRAMTMLVAMAATGLAMAQQAAVIGTLDGHTEAVYSVSWSPDGKTLATAGFDGTVRLWEVASRKELRKYEGHSKLVLSVAVSPNGKQILSGSNDNTAKLWDIPAVEPRRFDAREPIKSLALSEGRNQARNCGR